MWGKKTNKKTKEYCANSRGSALLARKYMISGYRQNLKVFAVLARIPLKMADTEVSSQNSQKPSQFSQSDLPELLNQYYKRLFPYKYFVQWLSYGGGSEFLKYG